VSAVCTVPDSALSYATDRTTSLDLNRCGPQDAIANGYAVVHGPSCGGRLSPEMFSVIAGCLRFFTLTQFGDRPAR
jgi:hypothetical protein